VNSKSLLYTEYTSFRRVDAQVSCHGHGIIALKLRLALGFLNGTLGLALKLSGFSLCLASQLVCLARSLTSEVVGIALCSSGAETSSLLDLLCHLAGLFDALDGGASDALAFELSGGLWVEWVSYVVRVQSEAIETADVFWKANDGFGKRLT
jgi:hypothetical protein